MTQSRVLLACIADAPIAVRADEVEAVVRIGDIVPIPLATLAQAARRVA